MPDDIFSSKAHQEWKRLQKALRKDPQNPTLLKDLYQLYISVEKIYWKNHETEKSQKLESLYHDIATTFDLDTDTVHRNLAEGQIKTLQNLLKKYPHNVFLRSTLQATIDDLDPWINHNFQKISSEDQTETDWKTYHNKEWRTLKRESKAWFTAFKNKHNGKLHFTKIGWQLRKDLASQATDFVVKYLLLKDLKEFKSHVKTIIKKRKATLHVLTKKQLLAGLEQYNLDLESIFQQHIALGIENLTKKYSNSDNKNNLYHWLGIGLSYVRPFYDFGGNTKIPEEYNPWEGENASEINIVAAYEETIKNKTHSLEDFFLRVKYFCNRFTEFREHYPDTPSYLNESEHVFWDEGKGGYSFKDPHSLLNNLLIRDSYPSLYTLFKELDPKLESFLSNIKANIDHLDKEYKKIVPWETALDGFDEDWKVNYLQDKKTVGELLAQQKSSARDQITYKTKKEGIKKLFSEALTLHQLQEKYEGLRLLREQDPYNINWHEETEKIIVEINSVLKGMSPEAIEKKITETETVIQETIEKQGVQGRIIIASIPDYLKSPYLRDQARKAEKIAALQKAHRQLKVRYDLLQYDVFKAQREKWQAFLKAVEENYQQTLSQISPNIATWRQIKQDLQQVDENFEKDALRESLAGVNSDEFEFKKCQVRVWYLTLNGTFFPKDNAILQKRFNRLTDHLGNTFTEKIKSLSYKDFIFIENFLSEMQAGRNTLFDAVLYNLKQEYSRKFGRISKNRELQTLYQEYAQKAQTLVKNAPPHYRQDRQIFFNIMQTDYQLLKQGKDTWDSFAATQELLNHTKNNYNDSYWLYAYLDANWMCSPKSKANSDQLKTWIKTHLSHIDLNLLAVEKYWNDCVFKIETWQRRTAGTVYPINIKNMVEYFLPVAEELVEASPSQHLKERKRFRDQLNKFLSDCTTRFNQHETQPLSHNEIGHFSTTHDPSASIRNIHNDFDNNDSINLLIRDEQIMPFPDMRNDLILGPFSSSPQHISDHTHWALWGILSLTSPAQGWEKVEQLVKQGVTGVELNKALMEAMKDAGLKTDTTAKLQTQITELQQQHKSPYDILKALQKTIHTTKTNQNPWRFSNTQIGGLVSNTPLPSEQSSTTFTLDTSSFYTWETAFDPTFKPIDKRFPFSTTPGTFSVVPPGMATKADGHHGAYVFNQPQQEFSYGQGQGAFYLPLQPQQDEFSNPHRHSNPTMPIEMPIQELPDAQEFRSGAAFAWVYTPKVVGTVPQTMNQARIIQLPVQVPYRVAVGDKSFGTITRRSFLLNTSRGYEGRVIPLHPRHSSPTTPIIRNSTSSPLVTSPLAKGVGYYMIARVTVIAGHEIYQGIQGQQSWGVTTDNLTNLASWVVIGICFSIALPKVAVVVGVGVIAHDFTTYVLPPRYPNSYLTSSDCLTLHTATLRDDYGDKAVISSPIFGAPSYIHIHTGNLNGAQQKVADAYQVLGMSFVRHIQPTRTHYHLQLLTVLGDKSQQATFVVGYWDNKKFQALETRIPTNYQDLCFHGAVKTSHLTELKLDDKTQHVLGITK